MEHDSWVLQNRKGKYKFLLNAQAFNTVKIQCLITEQHIKLDDNDKEGEFPEFCLQNDVSSVHTEQTYGTKL
jgi:hypothetical protein